MANEGPQSKHGGPPLTNVAEWSEARKIGFIEGATFMLKKGAAWAQELSDDGAKTVIEELLPQLERIFPDAEEVYAPLGALKKNL